MRALIFAVLCTSLVFAQTASKTGAAKTGASKTGAAKSGASMNPKLLTPAALKAPAPAEFKVKFTTTKGDFVMDVHRDWSPNGADRFYNLVRAGYFDNVR